MARGAGKPDSTDLKPRPLLDPLSRQFVAYPSADDAV
jgi:hypothetical protein